MGENKTIEEQVAGSDAEGRSHSASRSIGVPTVFAATPTQGGSPASGLKRLITAEQLARRINAIGDPSQLFKAHDAVRDRAAAKVRRALVKGVGVIQAEVMSGATAKRKKKNDDALLALLLLAAMDNYAVSVPALAVAPLTLGGHVYPPTPAKTPATPPAASGAPPANAAGARSFAAGRRQYLQEVPDAIRNRLEKAKSLGEQEEASEAEIIERVEQEAQSFEGGHGETIAQTEAQSVYGAAMMRVLIDAGFKTKIWATMEDERVRPTHVLCGQQGAIKMSQAFTNGLQYPGDPNGGPEEVCNCRCWLVGGSR
jgi:hypothetical protein